MFSTRPGLLLFSSKQPGSHVTLFGPHGPLVFRNDSCSFDDTARSYTWAFDHLTSLAPGQHFTFATTSWSVTGEVDEDGITIRVLAHHAVVIRAVDGKPLRVIDGQIKPCLTGDIPLVSIITCTYNRPRMLTECIESMIAQTCRSWEHLISDDGSTDQEAQQTLDAIVSRDQRFHVFFHPHIDQPAKHWNDLIDRSRGKYIGFLDDDNWKYPDFVERMSSVLDSDSSIDLVTCGWTVYDRDGNPNNSDLNLKTPDEIFNRNTIDTGAFLVRREALEKIGYFPLNIRTNEDWAMMRRAASCLNMVHLPEVLAVYRTHAGQRLEYREKLGNETDKATIMGTVWGPSYGVRVFSPPPERLTSSQRDVVEGARAGISAIPWIEEGSDLAVVLMPFQMDVAEAEHIAASHQNVVSIHSEDPFALHANLERVRAMARVRDETWVASNDTTCLGEYRAAVGPRLIVCPSLSIDHRATPVTHTCQHDVALVGYAYPGRIRFMREFTEHFSKKVSLFGDGWKEAGFDARPTTNFHNTAPVYSSARAVICLHRGHGDCVDGPHEPSLVARGYVEGCGGARVFIDTSRPDHPFENGEVEWFDGPADLAAKLTSYLAKTDEEQRALAEPLHQRALRDFTYRTRMARIINCVRSPRYEAVIP